MRLKSLLLSLSAVAVLSAGAAQASTNLVSNGGFESTVNGNNNQISANNKASDTTVVDWTSSNGNNGGWNFVLDSTKANTNKSALWLNINSSVYTASPNGGNFVVSDPMWYPGAISQTITGLSVGTQYTLTFDYALAQQAGYKNGNSDYWQVSFGSATDKTPTLTIAQGGFSGWQTETMTFTATGASQVLSFLAKAAAPGAPPFMMLDGVSLVAAAVPEPSTWAMLLGGMGLVGFMARRRAGKQA